MTLPARVYCSRGGALGKGWTLAAAVGAPKGGRDASRMEDGRNEGWLLTGCRVEPRLGVGIPLLWLPRLILGPPVGKVKMGGGACVGWRRTEAPLEMRTTLPAKKQFYFSSTTYKTNQHSKDKLRQHYLHPQPMRSEALFHQTLSWEIAGLPSLFEMRIGWIIVWKKCSAQYVIRQGQYVIVWKVQISSLSYRFYANKHKWQMA